MRTRLPAAVTMLLAAATVAGGALRPAVASANDAARAEREAARATRLAEREALRNERATRRDERRSRASDLEAPPAGGETPSTPSGETSEDATAKCVPTVLASASQVIAGATVTLSGEVTCPGRETVAGMHVAISSGLSAAVAADGSYEVISAPLTASTVFRVRFGRRDTRVAVKVAPRVTLAAPSSPPAATATLSTVAPTTPVAPASEDAVSATPESTTTTEPPSTTEPPIAHGDTRTRVTFTGTVTPAAPGAVVALQLAGTNEGEWRTVSFGRVAADGTYAVSHRFRTAGTAKVRVLAHAHGDNVNGLSEVLSCEISPATTPGKVSATASPAS
jgi:hypothetical protein